MKKLFLILLPLACYLLPVQAQDDVLHAPAPRQSFSFLNGQKAPDALKYLPAPPTENDALYQNDIKMYEWGKKQRETLRCDTAKWDAADNTAYIMKRFGWAIGKDLTPEKYPNLAKLVSGVTHDANSSVQNAKRAYARHRPYQIMKEHTPTPEWERDSDFTSYPSGHSVRAWATALLFVTLDPAHENEMMKTGYDMCESRVILGYHFQSDVEAARLAASAAFARICAEPTFWAYFRLAQDELVGKEKNKE